ncbi:hypothetical protein FPV67DRAFT_250041 [Lyophyllum atratum]|nr:hypothetical protein FPV67DRAFT_250041 [Lyophyllum atratum]
MLVASTVLTYDFLCTLDREVKYIWSNSRNAGSILFMVNRYLPFVDTGIAFKYLIMCLPTPKTCRTLNLIMSPILHFGVLLSEVILMLRTYAIWNLRRTVLFWLCFLGLVLSGSFVFLVVYATQVLQFGPPPQDTDPFPYGCRILKGSHRATSKFYMEVLLSETIILVLTMIKAFQHRDSRSRWVSRLYIDGMWFYFYMLLVTVSNITVFYKARSLDHKEILVNIQRVLHSICCNRVILDIHSHKDLTHPSNSSPSRINHMEGVTLSEFFTTVVPELQEDEVDDTVHEQRDVGETPLSVLLHRELRR